MESRLREIRLCKNRRKPKTQFLRNVTSKLGSRRTSKPLNIEARLYSADIWELRGARCNKSKESRIKGSRSCKACDTGKGSTGDERVVAVAAVGIDCAWM